MTSIVGARIVAVRPMTQVELEGENWEGHWQKPLTIQLDNGLVIYASMDGEGNGPGVLFGRDNNAPEGEMFFRLEAMP